MSLSFLGNFLSSLLLLDSPLLIIGEERRLSNPLALAPSRRRARSRSDTLTLGVAVEVLVLLGDLEGVPLRRRAR